MRFRQGFTRSKRLTTRAGGQSYNDDLLLIEPEVARQYLARLQAELAARTVAAGGSAPSVATPGTASAGKAGASAGPGPALPVAKSRSFRGSIEVKASLAKSQLHTLADEVIALLASDPNASVRVVVEIDAEFPTGVSDTIKRGVSENANSLGFRTKAWE